MKITFAVLLRNRLISAGLELVISHSEKSYYIQFSTNNETISYYYSFVLSAPTYYSSGLILQYLILLFAENCIQYKAINNY